MSIFWYMYGEIFWYFIEFKEELKVFIVKVWEEGIDEVVVYVNIEEVELLFNGKLIVC